MNKSFLIAYVDFLSAIVAVLVTVIVLLLSVNHQVSQGNITSKAEFIATVEWPEDSIDDVDLWIEIQLGNILFYKTKDIGLMSLDRDDTGIDNNSIIGSDGQKIDSPVRRETGSIRSIIPGETTVNVMLYHHRTTNPVKVKVQVIKLNPYRVIVEKEITLDSDGEEKTIVTFMVNPDGTVGDIDTISQISLVKKVYGE